MELIHDDFLLHSERRFRRDFAADHGECGNRWRPSEMAALFRSAGFEVCRIAPLAWAEPEELRRVIPRLRRSRSPYRNWPEEDLRILSACFELGRTDDPALRQQGVDEVAAQQRLKTDSLDAR